jgi:hypothetical protein
MICSDRDAGHAVMNVDAIQPLTHRWIKGKMAPSPPRIVAGDEQERRTHDGFRQPGGAAWLIW